MVPSMRFACESAGICPERKTMPLALMAWVYGPIAGYSVRLVFVIWVVLHTCDSFGGEYRLHRLERRRRDRKGTNKEAA
jgi:hypothetical protein